MLAFVSFCKGPLSMFVFLNLRTSFSNVKLHKESNFRKSRALEFWFLRYDVKLNFTPILEPIEGRVP